MKRKQYLIGLDLCPPTKISVITLAEFKEGCFDQKVQAIIKETYLKERRDEIKKHVFTWAGEYDFSIDDNVRWQLDFIDLFRCDLIIKVSSKHGNKN